MYFRMLINLLCVYMCFICMYVYKLYVGLVFSVQGYGYFGIDFRNSFKFLYWCNELNFDFLEELLVFYY